MVKVGIMSMQRILNYGSFLQAYGLKRIIEDLGAEVQFVDYKIDAPIVEKKINKSKKLKHFWKISEILGYDAPLIQKIKFIKYKIKFKKIYQKELGISNLMNYNPKIDVLIIGSDEVFNCIQENSNVGYSLELFGKDNKANRLVSYAASFGNTTLKKLNDYKKIDEVKFYLKKFDEISVRDRNSAHIINRLTNVNPQINIDPVLVYDYVNKFKKIKTKKIKEKYLLLYAYSGRISDFEAKWILKYAKRKNLKVYSMGGVQKFSDKFIDCPPFEVLNYFSEANEIITDTFHGTIFSIINHKRFVTLMRKSIGGKYGNEEKLSYLLEKFKLSSRLISDIENAQDILENNIDYEEADSILQIEREKSIEYLKNNIF
ncbi:polysaccharide pyruvyl transferase family protein [Ligilactobacillus sp. WILCCON 0076]|uniref:Polysaccharide pyruvyl transferase family protein n=1 Tax=Ligilactobacillus ubinensis TaxID=2876789 RepID=A0A9X2JN82_9LACO|nr:polysaccharide pyruvyl transferase family protein [Ligilactobacillus ubinensis]MCP0888045.1 polysaccharide pyruvyl transferase family protein [Ligilactobacillus ubinensis]